MGMGVKANEWMSEWRPPQPPLLFLACCLLDIVSSQLFIETNQRRNCLSSCCCSLTVCDCCCCSLQFAVQVESTEAGGECSLWWPFSFVLSFLPFLKVKKGKVVVTAWCWCTLSARPFPLSFLVMAAGAAALCPAILPRHRMAHTHTHPNTHILHLKCLCANFHLDKLHLGLKHQLSPSSSSSSSNRAAIFSNLVIQSVSVFSFLAAQFSALCSFFIFFFCFVCLQGRWWNEMNKQQFCRATHQQQARLSVQIFFCVVKRGFRKERERLGMLPIGEWMSSLSELSCLSRALSSLCCLVSVPLPNRRNK